MATTTTKSKSCSIAKVLNEHKEELFALINIGKVKECRKRAIELLADPRITDKAGIATAKKAFERPNDNLFMSCLMTYITCLKVS